MENKSFKPETIEYPGEGRELARYEEIFAFSKEELNGKRVLDLGTSKALKFPRDLHKAGIDVEVVGLSPDFLDEKYSVVAGKHKDKDTQILAAVGHALPFKDGVFDYIFMLHVLDHLPHVDHDNEKVPEKVREMLPKTFLEMARVLKPGGVAHIGPAMEWTQGVLLSNQSFLEGIKNLKTSIQFEEFRTEHYRQMKIYDTVSGVSMGYAPCKRIKMIKE